MPAMISQYDEDEEPNQPRYNLRSRPNLVNSVLSPELVHLRSRAAVCNSDIDPSIIPGININRSTSKYTRGLAAANHALQLWQLHTTMATNFPNEGFAHAIIDEETGKSLEFRHLINLDKVC